MTDVKIKVNADTTLVADGDGLYGGYQAGAGVAISNNIITRSGAGVDRYTVENHGGDDTLANGESGTVHTNRGSGGLVVLTLPDPGVEGVFFIFCVQQAEQLRIDPDSATIRIDDGQDVDKYIWADAIGETITLICNSNGDWYTITQRGNWTVEA